ncbi:MAG: ABC transporter ATP-binding protein [Capsulimonadales bacterium]|nr:ABC transporter ATP-binding protein [Capsulimonadales bacterium]
MSSETAVSVRGLGKTYRITPTGSHPGTLAETVLARVTGRAARAETFHALRDVSFEIREGTVVGIIGRNGAGKSTLLKLLSRITEPTSGRIDLYGRVGSLLEVGTGFHPELTGRENIFLNGAILGMTRREIARRFEAIVEFAGTEAFLDLPVKRYSSGMYVRLAFAVAAHLEPEILIVDEVLAVGDAEFQKKCVGKMQEVSHGAGRTVIVVSHNLATVRTLCDEGILLREGRVASQGPIRAVIEAYLAAAGDANGEWIRNFPLSTIPGVYLMRVRIRDASGKVRGVIPTGQAFVIEADVRATGEIPGTQVNFRLVNPEGVNVMTTTTADVPAAAFRIPVGVHRLSTEIPGNLLLPGEYSLCCDSFVPNVVGFDHLADIVRFRLENSGTHVSLPNDGRLGVVGPILPWRLVTGVKEND